MISACVGGFALDDCSVQWIYLLCIRDLFLRLGGSSTLLGFVFASFRLFCCFMPGALSGHECLFFQCPFTLRSVLRRQCAEVRQGMLYLDVGNLGRCLDELIYFLDHESCIFLSDIHALEIGLHGSDKSFRSSRVILSWNKNVNTYEGRSY